MFNNKINLFRINDGIININKNNKINKLTRINIKINIIFLFDFNFHYFFHFLLNHLLYHIIPIPFFLVDFLLLNHYKFQFHFH